MYSFLSVSTATLWTTDLLHLHMKNPVCKWCVLFLLPQQMYNCAIVQCLPSSIWCPVLTQSPSCPWRFKSLGMWCCVFGWVVPNLYFIFRVRQSKPSWAWKWMHYDPLKCWEQHADNTALCPRRLESSAALLWRPQILQVVCHLLFCHWTGNQFLTYSLYPLNWF
jgi:hypothetical protein